MYSKGPYTPGADLRGKYFAFFKKQNNQQPLEVNAA